MATKQESSVRVDGTASPKQETDEAWKFLDKHRHLLAAEAPGALEIAKIRRKNDFRIVPLLFCCYTMQFLDKVILNVSDTGEG